MKPVYDRFGVTVYHGDNLDVLREMPDESIDSIVTDPPAGIGFMREWDSDRGGREQWVAWLRARMTEALRVLKPGGHALVWALPRTSHWTGLAVEDAGFEVRDVIQHVFDNGFPKSTNISAAIDKRHGVTSIQEFAEHLSERRAAVGLSRAEVSERVVGTRSGACWNWESAIRFPEARRWPALRDLLGLDEKWGNVLAEVDREVVGQRSTGSGTGRGGVAYIKDNTQNRDLTAPSSPEAKRWAGWGTGLRPASEPWWLVRRPIDAVTVAASVVQTGTGAINIDGARGPDGQWPANVAKFPKAPPSERPMVNGEQHPTVKSVALCRWLVRLVTPPGGTVLDLFAGTGSVGQAARAEGMRAVLIEQDEQSIGFIKARLDARPKTQAGAAQTDEPMDLLDLLGGDAS